MNMFSDFLKGTSAKGPFSGQSPVTMFTDAFKKVVQGEKQENIDNAIRCKGFRDKHVKEHLPFLRRLQGWGSYKVMQTRYPSHYNFRECRQADMAHKARAQEKRARKNAIRLATFARTESELHFKVT